MKTPTPKLNRNSIAKAVETLLEVGARQTVVYQHPLLVVKATRHLKPDRRMKSETIHVTIGRPAYRERKHIKSLLRAGEPFPVKRVQIRWYPSK